MYYYVWCRRREKSSENTERERYDVTKVKSILSTLNVEENENVEDEVDEIRLGTVKGETEISNSSRDPTK